MTALMPNTTAAEAVPDDIPLRADSSPYRFEMLFNGENFRAFGSTADELLGFLISGYDSLGEHSRLAARMFYAAGVQTRSQARINDHFDLSALNDTEYGILTEYHDSPVEVTEWLPEVPLVLVDMYYEPIGTLPRPASGIADVENPPNIYWVSPLDSYDLIHSLHRMGVITVHEHVSHRP